MDQNYCNRSRSWCDRTKLHSSMQAHPTAAVHMFIDKNLEMERLILLRSAFYLSYSCVPCIQLLIGNENKSPGNFFLPCSLASLLLFRRGSLLIGMELSQCHLEPDELWREPYSWKMLSILLNPPTYTRGYQGGINLTTNSVRA